MRKVHKLLIFTLVTTAAIATTMAITDWGMAQSPEDPTPLPVTPAVTSVHPPSHSGTNSNSPEITGVDIVLVIDRSGSMGGGDLDDAQLAAQQFVDLMDLSQDQVALVSFSSSETLDHPLTQDGDSVKSAIDLLSSGGGTVIDKGITLAQTELERSRHIADNAPGMIILSDGQNNDGPDPVTQAANQAKLAGIRIFSIGLSSNVDEQTLEGAASSADDYYFAPSSAELQEIYAKIAGGVRPSPQGDLQLHLPSSFPSTQSLIVDTTVFNHSSSSAVYSVTLSLEKGAHAVSQTKSALVAWGSQHPLSFDFGPRTTGSYLVSAELQAQGSQLSKQSGETYVISESAMKVGERADELQNTAQQELDQMAGVPARGLTELIFDLSDITWEWLSDKILDKLIELIKPLTDKIGIPGLGGKVVSRVDEIFATIELQRPDLIAEISVYVKETHSVQIPYDFDPLNPALDFASGQLKEKIENLIKEHITAFFKRTFASWWTKDSERDIEDRRDSLYNTLESGSLAWEPEMAPLFSVGSDCVSNIVESDSLVQIGPRKILGRTIQYNLTLQEQEAKLQQVQTGEESLGKIQKYLTFALIIIGSILILAAFFVSGPLGIAVAGKVITYFKMIPKLFLAAKILLAFVILLLVVGMMISVPQLAPHVVDEYNNTLEAVESLSGTRGQNVILTSLDVSIQDSEVQLDNPLLNAGPRGARVLLGTVIYTADGRPLECRWSDLDLAAQRISTQRRELILPAGQYKTVSAVHTEEKVGLSTQTETFDVTMPEVLLDVSIKNPQVTLGEAVQANIYLTNTSPISGVTDLVLASESSDNKVFQSWSIDLAAGESEKVEFRFVPQKEGGFVLRTLLLGEVITLASDDVGYVVGNGTAVTLDWHAQDVYDPNINVTAPFTAVNAGNQPTTTTVSLVTVDRLHNFEPQYTQTLTLTLSTDGVQRTNFTFLEEAQPGFYETRIMLGGTYYDRLDFFVAALDTLYVSTYADRPLYDAGDTVTLKTSVRNSTYDYITGVPTVTLWTPTGVTQTVDMTNLSVGQYEGTFVTSEPGTYLARTSVDKPGYRVVEDQTSFIVEKHSLLRPDIDGELIVNQSSPLTITVKNENRVSIVDARVVVSNTKERLTYRTDEEGQVVLWDTPAITAPYHLLVEKNGFAQTKFDLPVQTVTDTVPPPLTVVAPDVTNQGAVTVTGITEYGALVTLNHKRLDTDAQGRFTDTISLNEGSNTLIADATDASGNSTVITQALELDVSAPMLSIKHPPEEMETNQKVISVTGETLDAQIVSVNGRTVDIVSGEFRTWTLLEDGTNTIVVEARDEAGNAITETVRVVRPTSIYLPVVLKDYDTSPPAWSPAGLSGHTVYALACDSTDCTIRYAGTDDGFYKSTDTGATWSASGLDGALITSIAVAPDDSQTLYVATWGQGVYESTDAGSSWSQINDGLGGKHWLYAVTVAPGGALYAGTYDGGVYKSANGGDSWSSTNGGLGDLNVRSLIVDPTHAQTLYVGTTDGVYKSTNGGSSWSAAGSGTSGREVRTLAISPADSSTIFAGTDSGVYRSVDSRSSWSRSGLANEAVQAMIADPLNAQEVYAGTNGSGVYHSSDGGGSWSESNGGLGNSTIESFIRDDGSCQTLQIGTNDGIWTYLE
jgi:photosystem II stability/assembly factor-like uncharacterized protein/uncharacterized protein YegL